MSYLVSLKMVRLLLAVSVSIWLAGGCLFGCSNTAMAATDSSEKQAVEGESCHAERSHDCCAKAKAKPKPAKQTRVNVNRNLSRDLAGVSSLPTGSMSDCPLMVGATAVVSKSSSNSPELAGSTTAARSLPVNDIELPQRQIVEPFLPNRGPTYLRCCVFLI
ncbi:MAG TPA: hypothetical protein VFZ22_22295 [Pyrinomonadaceae bacterium]|nr:hypothetical protein [Pyrinomonadaceae bacterium]